MGQKTKLVGFRCCAYDQRFRGLHEAYRSVAEALLAAVVVVVVVVVVGAQKQKQEKKHKNLSGHSALVEDVQLMCLSGQHGEEKTPDRQALYRGSEYQRSIDRVAMVRIPPFRQKEGGPYRTDVVW